MKFLYFVEGTYKFDQSEVLMPQILYGSIWMIQKQQVTLQMLLFLAQPDLVGLILK